MAENPRTSTSTEGSSTQRKPPNFSRPRPVSSQPSSKQGRNSNNNTTHTISAFHEPNRDLPAEPRFSVDSERTYNTSSENSASSDFAWDGQTGELSNKFRPKRFDEQRYARPEGSRSRPPTTTTPSSGSVSTTKQGLTALPNAPSSSTSKLSNITKRVSVDQKSERLPKPPDQFEDTASHHTVSESGESGSYDIEEGSEYDTGGMTDAEIRKLQRKGINPALYAEMKAAKKGKRWVGPLLGNGFLS